ncbi:TIGR01440 family protein [Paenibacillus lautus]|uniref:TIGR01440 family protein n=1 Tax=Paenibacillus lautus TaxID=1401 RepID=UPI002DC00E57|nr:TIGR01440 family protein [Paenibacillus lautus]MEC0311336.1 TIGR01440 family protein [Paenibacillus lautus]
MTDISKVSLNEQTTRIVRELAEAAVLGPGKVLVIGASTSEVVGRRIGTGGALETAQQLLQGIAEVQTEFGFAVAYQCCEHLNRALVMERELLERLGLTEVAAVPIPRAGGSMASAAYRSMKEPCLAESIEAHAGVDIGETLIGMHLRRVAVPFRPSERYIGEARVTAAYTRPKLIGGERAVYRLEQRDDSTLCD